MEIPTPACSATVTTNCGVYPNGIAENIYQYESAGIFRQNQLFANATIRPGTGRIMSRMTLNGFYVLNYADSTPNAAANGGFGGRGRGRTGLGRFCDEPLQHPRGLRSGRRTIRHSGQRLLARNHQPAARHRHLAHGAGQLRSAVYRDVEQGFARHVRTESASRLRLFGHLRNHSNYWDRSTAPRLARSTPCPTAGEAIVPVNSLTGTRSIHC